MAAAAPAVAKPSSAAAPAPLSVVYAAAVAGAGAVVALQRYCGGGRKTPAKKGKVNLKQVRHGHGHDSLRLAGYMTKRFGKQENTAKQTTGIVQDGQHPLYSTCRLVQSHWQFENRQFDKKMWHRWYAWCL
jgi:hypothetical protein